MYKLDDLYEIGLEDRKTGKRWAGENYGWQSQESYDKLFVAGKLNKTQQAIDRFGNYVYTTAQADPVVGPALRFIGGVARTVSQITPKPVKEAASFVLSKNQEAAENIAYATGLPVTLTDPTTIADVAVGGASLAAKPAVKTAVKETVEAAANIGRNFPPTPPSTPQFAMAGAGGPQITMRNGSVNLQPPIVMKAVTATDAPTLAGVRGGIQTGADLVTGSQGKRLIKRDLDIEGYRNTIETKVNEMKALRELRGDPKRLKEFVDNASPELQAYWKAEKGNIDKIISRLDGNKKNAQEGLSRAQSNVLPFDTTKRAAEIGSSENVNYFRSKVGLTAKKAEESARAVQGYLEQHHLFPKGMSAAFFGKMDELISKGKATKDDLILMAEFTANQGRRTGDVKANLINMAKDPHNELHTILRAQGAELKKSDYVRMLENVDNVDDLLVKWRELLAGDAAYNIETAKIWEPLDDLLKEIQK